LIRYVQCILFAQYLIFTCGWSQRCAWVLL